MLSAEQMAKNYVDAMQTTQTKQRYIDGINSTTVNPMEEAAKANDLFLQRVTESVTSGRRTTALLKVPVPRWKQNSVGEGANRLGTGAKKASDKQLEHFRIFRPVYLQIQETCRQMPKGGTEEALAKVRVNIEMQKKAAGKS